MKPRSETARRVLITGAAGGMGLACAARMGASGDPLLLTDVSAPALEKAVRELTREGFEASGFACDLADARCGKRWRMPCAAARRSRRSSTPRVSRR